MSFNNTKTPTKPSTPAKWQVPMRPHSERGVMEYYLDGELKERFCQLFPKNSNRRLMQWFGISFSTLQRFKHELGLEKDMRAIRKQQAKDTKVICEKNGYYDSLRGKLPSEACMEGARQMRANGFHPMRQLKANNPQNSSGCCARRASSARSYGARNVCVKTTDWSVRPPSTSPSIRSLVRLTARSSL